MKLDTHICSVFVKLSLLLNMCRFVTASDVKHIQKRALFRNASSRMGIMFGKRGNERQLSPVDSPKSNSEKDERTTYYGSNIQPSNWQLSRQGMESGEDSRKLSKPYIPWNPALQSLFRRQPGTDILSPIVTENRYYNEKPRNLLQQTVSIPEQMQVMNAIRAEIARRTGPQLKRKIWRLVDLYLDKISNRIGRIVDEMGGETGDGSVLDGSQRTATPADDYSAMLSLSSVLRGSTDPAIFIDTDGTSLSDVQSPDESSY